MQWFVSILGEETARQLNRAPDDFNVDLNMYDLGIFIGPCR